MAIIQGEAQVGKTCIKSLILELPYNEVSTSCIEAPCVAFGNFSINRYGKTNNNRWRLVSDDEMDGIVIAELKEIASYSKYPNKIIRSPTAANRTMDQSVRDIEAMSYASVLCLCLMHLCPTSPEVALTSNAVQDLNTEDSLPVVNSPIEDIDVPIPVLHEERIDVHVEEAFENDLVQNYDVHKYLKEKYHTSKVGFDRDWLYFFDSGGQIQFQKLLLAFMPCSSVLVLVVNLSKSLSDRSSTSMKLPDVTINVNEYSLKVDDMLRQVISAVDSNTKQFRSIIEGQQHIKPPKNEKLQVITIGTHRDIYNKQGKGIEDIKTKRGKLKSMLQSESIQIAYKDDTNLLHEVDGREAKHDGEFDDPAIETISKALNEQAYEIEVPLKWHYFGVILRNESKETGMLKLSSCIGFGKLLDMSKKEVTSALNFFHALKLLFHYHDSPAKDIVFVKLDAVINVIRKLMITVCKPLDELKVGPDKIAQLAAKGYLSIEVLEKNAGVLKGNENILLGLFEYLKIAALIQTDEKDAVFLMPALLPVKDVSDVFATPLLFYFNDEPVPMGLFCAVIVQLLTYSGDEKWHIITKERNYSNFFTLQKNYSPCQVILVEQLYCIEVYCEDCFFRQDTKNSIKKAINDAMNKKLTNRPVPAFYCPCKDKVDDIAKVQIQDSTNKVFIKCDTTGYQKLSDSQCDEYWSWFITQQEIEQAKLERQKDEPNSTLEGECIISYTIHISIVTM